MLDQDARPETAPLAEPSSPRTARSSRGWAALLVVIVVLVGAIAFAVGRATDDNGTSRAVTTRSAKGNGGGAGKAGVAAAGKAGAAADVPTRNLDEVLESKPDKPLDNATRDALAADLVAARTVAEKYPTVADATAAHLVQAGKFAPGAGAHFIDYANTSNEIRPDGSVDVTKPGSYIYDGVSPTSRLVGLMYISLADQAPAGLPGPNDHWHRHSNLCIKYGPSGIQVPFAPDRDVTKAQCDTVGGQFMQKTVWMVHAWVVPGWESPKGVFSHANPNLTCADGTMNANAIGFCKGT